MVTTNKSLAFRQDILDAVRVTSDGFKALMAREKVQSDNRFEDMESRLVLKLGKIVEKELSSQLEEIRNLCNKKIDTLQNEVSSIRSFYESGLKQFKELIEAMPTPEIILPEGAVQIQLSTPTINIPKDSIQVIIPETAIRVEPAQITVDVPRRTVEKTIQYDQNGYPVHITEKEI